MSVYIPPPLPSPHSLHTYLIYLFERFSDSGFLIVLIPPQIYSLDYKYNIGYWRHVGMSAWLDPPPILPTTKHDIHIVSACRHVFITALNFLHENIKWTILWLSACRHVGIYSSPPPLPPLVAHMLDLPICEIQWFVVSACFDHNPDISLVFKCNIGYCRHVGMSACRHVGMVWPPSYIADNQTWQHRWCRHFSMII